MSGTYCTDGHLCLAGCSSDQRKCEHESSLCLWEIVDLKAEHAHEIFRLQQELAQEIKNKKEFERGWLECCDKLISAERQVTELSAKVEGIVLAIKIGVKEAILSVDDGSPLENIWEDVDIAIDNALPGDKE